MQSKHKSLPEYLEYIENKGFKGKSNLSILKNAYSQLGVDQLSSFVITVTGTNGKGSTVGLLEDIFIAQGYTVGSNTSPHLINYNERIKYNGIAISDEAIINAFSFIDSTYGENNALCYSHYAFLTSLVTFIRLKPDIIIFEVGLGGRLDPANTVDADISIITSIGIDHVELLGNTREKIGLEKCAISRAGKPLIIADLDVPGTVLDYCKRNNVQMKCIQKDFKYKQSGQKFTYIDQNGNQEFMLADNMHPHSVASALAVMNEMPEKFVFSNLMTRSVIKSFFIPGRKHFIQSKPYIILDVGHNLNAVKSLFKFITTKIKRNNRISVLFSAMNNKDIKGIVEYVDTKIDYWNVVSFNYLLDRGASLNQLKLFFENKTNVTYYQSISDSYYDAKEKLCEEDCLIVFGSFVLVGEILNLVNKS